MINLICIVKSHKHVQVKLPLCLIKYTITKYLLIKYHSKKTYCGSGGIVLCILNLDIRWEWSASRSGRFSTRKEPQVPNFKRVGG
jgi:hypothetical protein